MSSSLLNMDRMPFEQTFVCKDGSEIDLRAFLARHKSAVGQLAENGLVKPNASFGFAMARPLVGDDELGIDEWDDPGCFVWFVGGWGPNSERYGANAIRKLRPLLRADAKLMPEESTLALRFSRPTFFQDKVESQNEDGTFPWGDFPWGGAVTLIRGPLVLHGAVSCLTEVEDDVVASLILGGFARLVIQSNNLLSDD